MERTPCNQAEVEKLIAEKNAVGPKKFRLEGTRIFFLGVNFGQSVSNYACFLKFHVSYWLFYRILFWVETIEFCCKYRVCEKCTRRVASITGRIWSVCQEVIREKISADRFCIWQQWWKVKKHQVVLHKFSTSLKETEGHKPKSVGRSGGLMVSDIVSGASGPEPWPGTLCCVLGQATIFSRCLSPPRCINRYWWT